jgi:hypothetical protein
LGLSHGSSSVLTLGLNSKPSYFIEGTTALDGESTSDHQDGQSHDNNPQQQNPQQEQPQADSYVS